jgi:hypothetical protein
VALNNSATAVALSSYATVPNSFSMVVPNRTFGQIAAAALPAEHSCAMVVALNSYATVPNSFSMVVPNRTSGQIAAALPAEHNCAAALRNAAVLHSRDCRSAPVAAVAVQRSDDCRSAAHCNSACCYNSACCAVVAYTNGCHSARHYSVSNCSAKDARYSSAYYRLLAPPHCLPLPMADGLNLQAAACWS